MSGYTKLFASIVHSTIWRAPDHVRITWITMLALADREGIVEASIPGLADAARVSIDQCKAALEHLSSPDEWSRTPDHEGRRIAARPGGWLILNHGLYRDRMTADVKRQQTALRVARFRERQRECNANVTPETHTAPTPDPDPEKDDPDTRDRARARGIPSTTTRTPTTDQEGPTMRKHDTALMRRHGARATNLLALLNDARRRVMPRARDLAPVVGNLLGIAERLEEGHTDEDVKHVIAVREAEVKRDRASAKWFDAVTPFRRDNFARALGWTVDGGSEGPRGVAAPATFPDDGEAGL